jgi:DNA topoisomerase-1
MRATGSVIAFDGFYRLYREDNDDREDSGDEDRERILPPLNKGDAASRGGVRPEQHFTQPPPRFSEASLVKRLEELGIGRPSTYASIISVLQDRGYVRLDKRRFIPEDRGRLVTAFLTSFFHRYVEYDFTADLEDKLDDISGGRVDWKTILREFWGSFIKAVDDTKELRVREVLDALNEILGPHFFRNNGTGEIDRKCPTCEDGELSLKLGKFGAFIGCSNYPECRFTRPLAIANGEDGGGAIADAGPKSLGIDDATGLDVTLRKGPYGYYVQLGEITEEAKPKRSSIPRGEDLATVNLERALGLLRLPREVGLHPETGEMITAAIGRFGPYIKHGATYVSLKDDDVLTVGLNRAVTLLADAPKRPAPETIGEHPDDGKPITLRKGRYGPYVQHGPIRATLPKDLGDEKPSLELAVEILKAKASKDGGGKGKTKGRAKTTKKKAPTKKSAATKADETAPSGSD